MITLEAATNILEGDDPFVVGLMIAFLYENDDQPRIDQMTTLVDEHHEDEEPGIGIEAPVSESPNNEILASIDKGDTWIAGKGRKAKKEQKKSAAMRRRDSSEDMGSPPPPAAFPKKLLPVHAKVFALGSKYDIPHLQRRSLAKFKADARLWSKDELIESIPLAFNTTLDNSSLRVAIKVIITENCALLADDLAFEDAVNGIEGLAFELFRLQTHHSRGQRICLGCNSVYESRCAVKGCPLDPFSRDRHTCDKGGLCVHCHN